MTFATLYIFIVRFATLESPNHNSGYITLSLDALIATESLVGEKKQKAKQIPLPQNPPGYETKSEDLMTLILSFKFDTSEEVFGS